MAKAKSAATKKPARSEKTTIKETGAKVKPAKSTNTAKRRLSLRRKKYAKRELAAPMSNVYRLFMDSLDLLRAHWRLFSGMLFVYIIMSVVLVGSLGSTLSLSRLRTQMETASAGSSQGLEAGFALFGQMASSVGGATSEAGSAYQSMVIVVMSLATIWVLRRLIAGKPATVRDAFYKSMTPLIPFILVLLVIGLQLVPLVIGGTIYGMAFANNGAQGTGEKFMWALLVFLLVLVSIYWICSSIFALYIVTLPDMRPMAALRSARGLVRYRRWTVLRKLLFLPFALLVIGVVICVPLIMYLAPIAPYVFLLLSMVALFVVHSYIYSLYRELL